MPVQTAVDIQLVQAVTAAASCDWQDTPATPVCGAVAVWVATLPCGCKHFCCHPHRGAAGIHYAFLRRMGNLARAIGLPVQTVCFTCNTPLDLTHPITWERI